MTSSSWVPGDNGTPPRSIGRATSGDGTTVGYRSRGRGPGVVVLHGALESSADYTDLAGALSDSLTVHVMDRRGRGLSGPHDPAGTSWAALAAEVDDVRAVLDATGARHLYGISSGGVIALQAALDLPGIDRVAVYEPALDVPGSRSAQSHAFIDRYETAMAQGQTAEAVVAILKGVKMGPRWLRILPRHVAALLVRRLLDDDQADLEDGVSLGSLVPTMHYDFQISDEGSARLDRFSTLKRPVLLLGGSKSPRYLKAALTALGQLLPDARRIELPRSDHVTSSNRDQGGHPDLVAHQLLDFFAPGRGAGKDVASARVG